MTDHAGRAPKGCRLSYRVALAFLTQRIGSEHTRTRCTLPPTLKEAHVMSEDACEVNPARWYLCAVYLTCQEPIPLVEVVRTAPRGSEASFVFKAVPCPRTCGSTSTILLRRDSTTRHLACPGELVWTAAPMGSPHLDCELHWEGTAGTGWRWSTAMAGPFLGDVLCGGRQPCSGPKASTERWQPPRVRNASVRSTPLPAADDGQGGRQRDRSLSRSVRHLRHRGTNRTYSPSEVSSRVITWRA
jgi:hypothetical protein